MSENEKLPSDLHGVLVLEHTISPFVPFRFPGISLKNVMGHFVTMRNDGMTTEHSGRRTGHRTTQPSKPKEQELGS